VPELHTPGYVLPVLWHTAFIFFRGGAPPIPILARPFTNTRRTNGPGSLPSGVAQSPRSARPGAVPGCV